jgi:hypothetical protein
MYLSTFANSLVSYPCSDPTGALTQSKGYDNDRHYKKIGLTSRFLQRFVHFCKPHGLRFGPCAKAYLTFIDLGKRPLIQASYG